MPSASAATAADGLRADDTYSDDRQRHASELARIFCQLVALTTDFAPMHPASLDAIDRAHLLVIGPTTSQATESQLTVTNDKILIEHRQHYFKNI